VIERALIQVAGPEGAGKTTFIAALLAAVQEPVLVARCAHDDALSAPARPRHRAAQSSAATARQARAPRPSALAVARRAEP
jgi:uridine kinase